MSRRARNQADTERETRSVRRSSAESDRSTENRDCDAADDRACTLGRLHDLAGNQAVKHLSRTEGIQRSAVDDGASGDRFEREAERVAEAVVNDEPDVAVERGRDASEAPAARSVSEGLCGRCQRRRREGKPQNCPDCEATLQRAAASGDAPSMANTPATAGRDRATESGSGGASSEAGADLTVSGGSGRPLSDSLRSEFEPRFGHDFGDVRVHTGPRAGDMARDLDALAFTVGRDVYFRPGAYRPSTKSGKRLLAHELTHVVQQGESEPVTTDRKASAVRTPTREAANASSAVRGNAIPSAQRQGTADAVRERPAVGRREDPTVRRQVLGIALGAGTLLGEAWLRLGRASKERFIGAAINAAIRAIDRFPGQSLLGRLWTFVRPGLLGFYRQLQGADLDAKITAMDKLARIMAGQSLEYAKGLLMGTVKGFFVDGLWGIFEAIAMIVRGISGLWDLLWAIRDAVGAFPDMVAELFANARQLAATVAGNIQPALQELRAILSSPETVSELIGPIVEAGQARATEMGQRVADRLLEFFTRPGAEAAIGEVTGRVIGVVLFEALFAYLTGGIGVAVTAIKSLARIVARLGGRVVSSALGVFRTLLPYLDIAVDAVRHAGRFLRGRVLGRVADQTSDLLTSIRSLFRHFLAHCRTGSIHCDFPETRRSTPGRAVDEPEAATRVGRESRAAPERAERPGVTTAGAAIPLSNVLLQRIRGIGPKRAARLREAGIENVEQLKTLSRERLDEILDPGAPTAEIKRRIDEFEPPTRRVGEPSPAERRLEWASRMESHHLIPKELLDQPGFAQRLRELDLGKASRGGEPDPKRFLDQQIADIPGADHNTIHGKVVDGMTYNDHWKAWYKEKPNFTKEELMNKKREMIHKFNIPKASLGGRLYGREKTPRVHKARSRRR